MPMGAGEHRRLPEVLPWHSPFSFPSPLKDPTEAPTVAWTPGSCLECPASPPAKPHSPLLLNLWSPLPDGLKLLNNQVEKPRQEAVRAATSLCGADLVQHHLSPCPRLVPPSWGLSSSPGHHPHPAQGPRSSSPWCGAVPQPGGGRQRPRCLPVPTHHDLGVPGQGRRQQGWLWPPRGSLLLPGAGGRGRIAPVTMYNLQINTVSRGRGERVCLRACVRGCIYIYIYL